MRIVVLVLSLFLASPVLAGDPPKEDRTDMGAWGCQGTKPKDVTIAPGTHAYVWTGECSGAEGFDIVIEPKDHKLVTKMTYDAKTKQLVLRVTNPGKRTVTVKMHVFVGFA